MHPSTIVCVWLGLTAFSSARAEETQTRAAAMERFERWVGTWKGTGWTMNEAGRRIAFDLEERVALKAGGTALLLEGKGVRNDDDGRRQVVHDGLSIVDFDPKSGKHRWDGHEFNRDPIHAELKPIRGGFQWEFDAEGRGAVVRFTVELTPQSWREIGEVSVDGKTWNRFMEMTLTKTK